MITSKMNYFLQENMYNTELFIVLKKLVVDPILITLFAMVAYALHARSGSRTPLGPLAAVLRSALMRHAHKPVGHKVRQNTKTSSAAGVSPRCDS